MRLSRVFPTLLAAATLVGTLGAPARGDEPKNWNEVARRVVPEVLARTIEFPDFVRVYRRGSATIDVQVAFSQGTPGRAEFAFAFHDKNDDGRLTDEEVEWKERYASADSIHIGLMDFRRGINALLTLPASFTLFVSRIDGEELPTGWKFSSSRPTEEGDVPLALYVNKDYVVERGEGEVRGIPTTQRFQYEVHGNRRATSRFLQSTRTRDGSAVETEVRFSYLEQDGCLLPAVVDTAVQVVTGFGSYLTRVTMTFQGWRGEKRPRALPRPGEDALRGERQAPVVPTPVVPTPVVPTPVVPTPVAPTPPPRPDVSQPGADDPVAYLKSLDRMYLSLAAGGIERLTLEVEDYKLGDIAFPWRRDRGFDVAPFRERRGETDLEAVRDALERNPLFSPFSTLHVTEAARMQRGPDGTVTVEDPGQRPPMTWTFGPDGALRTTRISMPDGDIVRSFEWRKAGGGLLLREVSLPMSGGTRVFERYTYALYGTTLAPSRILIGARTPEMGRHPAAEHRVYDFDVERILDANGVGAEAQEDVAEGDPLPTIHYLPPGPAPVPPTPVQPTPARPDLTPAELAVRLDEGLERLALEKRDLAADLKIRRGPNTYAATLYWLTPGRVAIAEDPTGTPLPADLRLLLEESLAANPLFVSHAVLLTGATLRRLPDGAYEATIPPAPPQRGRIVVADPVAGVRTSEGRDAEGRGMATAVRTLADGGPGSGRLADAVVLSGPGVGAAPIALRWKYTRGPGFVFVKRLVADGADPALEVLFENVRAETGQAAAWFQARGDRPGGGLFED